MIRQPPTTTRPDPLFPSTTVFRSAMLATRMRARDDVQQETFGAPGAEHPHTVVLRQQRGLRRARTADTMEAALLGACDGELTMGQILDALAQLLDTEPATARTTYLPVVRELVAAGFIAGRSEQRRGGNGCARPG